MSENIKISKKPNISSPLDFVSIEINNYKSNF